MHETVMTSLYNPTHPAPPPPPPYPRFPPLFHKKNRSEINKRHVANLHKSASFSIGTFSHFDTQRWNKLPPKRMRGPSFVAGNTANHDDWRPWLDPVSKTLPRRYWRGMFHSNLGVRLVGVHLRCRKGTSCKAKCKKGPVKSVKACVVLIHWVIHTREWHIFLDKRLSGVSVISLVESRACSR